MVDFHTEFGHTFVPTQGKDEDTTELGEWVLEVRDKKDNLSGARRKLLDELGFSFDIDGDWWETMYLQLVEFHKHHGHCRPLEHDEDVVFDPELASWVACNNEMFREGTLPQPIIQKLEALGFFPEDELERKHHGMDSEEHGQDQGVPI